MTATLSNRPEMPSRRGRRRTWIFLAGLLVAIAAFIGWQNVGHTAGDQQRAATTAPPPAIPVGLATAARMDVPIYLVGLGAVQAFNTVTVHVRVDGELQNVAFTEGQDVKAGDLLAQIDPRPFRAQLDQAEAKKVQDEALLNNAKRDQARFRELAKSQFATRQSVDTQNSTVSQFEAAVRGDQAMIDNAKVQLGYTTITSPLNGRTGIRIVDQGNIVHATDPNGLVVITQLQPISVIFTLPEGNLPALNKAMAAGKVSVLALSQDAKTKLGEGIVALVDNEIDQSTGTIRLKATFPNRDLSLWPGQFVNIRLLYTTLHQALTVPAGAVQRGAQGTFVYVVKPDNTVDVRWAKVGQIGDGRAVIESGIAEGERVVTDGQYRLQPGALVAATNGASVTQQAEVARATGAPQP